MWRGIAKTTPRPVSFFLSKLRAALLFPVIPLFSLILAAVWALRLLWGIDLAPWAAVQTEPLRAGALWQPLTYALCHGPWWHLAVNLAVLALTGGTLERAVGSRRMLALVLLAIPAGAVGFLLSLLTDPRLAAGTVCLGASALSAACFGAIPMLAPRARVTLWLLVVPVPFRAGWLLPLAGVLLCAEMVYAPALTAYGAHLGGWLLGVGFGFWAAATPSPFPGPERPPRSAVQPC